MKVVKGFILLFIALAAVLFWGWWDYGTPVALEATAGALAGFTIGQTKEEVLMKATGRVEPSSSNMRLDGVELRAALFQSQSWEAHSQVVSECPKKKQCPSETTLEFSNNRLAKISVKCHPCP